MLKVLEPSLMTNARDILQVHLGDPSVDRFVRNETRHFIVVAALTPDIADLDQGTVVINNPGQLIPRLLRRVIPRVKHQGK